MFYRYTVRHSGFTLIELLVVISIIALLIALLLPAIKGAKAQGKLVQCLSNLRQIGVAVSSYVNDANGFYPVPPLGEYIGSSGFDVCFSYMPYLIGGDDEGIWGITTSVPAEVRPLYGYIDPESHAFRCPADNGPNPWYYEKPVWDAGTSSYLYNAEPQWGFPGLYGLGLEDVTQPSIMIQVGDWPWWSTRTNLPDNDFVMFTTDPRPWWHPNGFEQSMVNICFVDGHAAYAEIQIRVPNTNEYRRDP